MNGGTPVFELTLGEEVLIHTTSCTGIGIGILNLKTKTDKLLSDKLVKAVLSPDGSQIAGIADGEIEVFDTTGKKLKTLDSTKPPVILSWSSDSKEIYYSSEDTVNELKSELGTMGSWISVNQVTLWKISLAKGESTKIATIDAHNLKPLSDKIGEGKLLAVKVENATKLYEYVTKNTTKEDLVKYYPTVQIIEVDLPTGATKVILQNVNQSSINIP